MSSDAIGEFVGVKFKATLEKKAPLFTVKERFLAKKMLFFCKLFEQNNLAPIFEEKGVKRNAGNLSFRAEKAADGFFITASGKLFSSQTSENDFVFVKTCFPEKNQVRATGLREPSSETFMHNAVYKARPEVNAVFHGHDEAILLHAGKLKLPVTKDACAYGTLKLGELAVKALGKKNNFVVLKGHGFASIGKTLQEAGELALALHEKAIML